MHSVHVLKIGLILVALLAITGSTATAADDPQARAIMERVDARDEGDNSISSCQTCPSVETRNTAAGLLQENMIIRKKALR